MRFFILSLVFLTVMSSVGFAYADTIKQTMEGGMDVEITYPDAAIIDRIFTISILVQNNGWEDKQDISFVFNSDDIIPVQENQIKIEKITAGSSHGQTIDFKTNPDTLQGSYFLNLDYSQVLLVNNEEPQDPIQTSIAIPIIIQEQAKVNIHTITPESIFANAEFPFTVEIISDDIDISDVQIQIISPKDIEFRGETLHTFSSIQKSEPLSITSRIITPIEEVTTEYKVPFQIQVSYKDDIGEEKTDSKTVSLVLRPRTFMELTTDGGIWVGDFFIAPYVSLGTIIGIPAGALLSLVIRRGQKTKKKTKRTKKKV